MKVIEQSPVLNYADQLKVAENPAVIRSELAALQAFANKVLAVGTLGWIVGVSGLGVGVYAYKTRADHTVIRTVVYHGASADVVSTDDAETAGSRDIRNIKANLASWVEKRLSKRRARIAFDYDDVARFLAEQPLKEFVGKDAGQFNASQVGKDFENCTHCPDVIATAHDPVFVDSFQAPPGAGYDQSHQWDILVDVKTNSVTERKRAQLNVRYLTDAEVEKRFTVLDSLYRGKGDKPSKVWLKANPSAIEIMNYTIKDDAAQ